MPRHSRGPEDFLTGQVEGVIERSWIVVVVRRADAGFDLHARSVVQPLRSRVVVQIEADAGSGAGGQFQSELFAVLGEDGGLNHAAFKNHNLAGACIDGGVWGG